ncbi:MAG: hypothetical protein II008_11200, partial [Oscillospiraceae bacterium]|nr:hypothetical protein [Oscillospiraceae bacterium]
MSTFRISILCPCAKSSPKCRRTHLQSLRGLPHRHVYEKTTRAPIRALQNYLEAEKGFPPDSKKSVYGLA